MTTDRALRIIDDTPFGPVALVWAVIGGRPLVTRVLIPHPGCSVARQWREQGDLPVATCDEMDYVVAVIRASLAGEDVPVPLEAADLSSCSPFQQAVLRAECRVPRGWVTTYRFIAAHLGRPRAARAVGGALAANPFPLMVPCHRVIRSDGHLGGYGGGVAMKRALLEGEGVEVDDTGRVVRPRFWP